MEHSELMYIIYIALFILISLVLVYTMNNQIKLQKEIEEIKMQQMLSDLPLFPPSEFVKAKKGDELQKKESPLRTWAPNKGDYLTPKQQAEEALRLLNKYPLGEGYIKWWLMFYQSRLSVQYIEINELPILFQKCFPGQFVAMSDGEKEFYGFINPWQRMSNTLNVIFFNGNEKDYALGEDKKYLGNFSKGLDGVVKNEFMPCIKLIGIERLDFTNTMKELSFRNKRVSYILEKVYWESFENEHAHEQHYLLKTLSIAPGSAQTHG